MEGIRLSTSRSYWILQRTPDTFPSFLNDIGQSMMEFVSEITRERIRFRANGYAPSLPVAVAQRQRRCVLHQDRQALRLERSRHLHAARHSRGDVHHLAGQLVSLVAGHAGQAGLHAVQARRGRRDRRDGGARHRRRRDGRARRCRRTSRAAPSGWASRTARRSSYMADADDAPSLADGVQGSASSRSSIRPTSRRASSDRRAHCSTTPPRARRRCRRSSR